MKGKRKLLSVILSAAMVFSMSAVGAFASENDTAVLSNATLIGAAPFAGATNVAVGSSTAPQPVRIALSEGAETVAADIGDYIQIKDSNGAPVAVTADTDGDIVVMTPSRPLNTNTTYTVDFDATNLPNISDYTFATSTGGTGGGGQGGQALTLTGQIPADGATIASNQTLYMVFSNSLLPGKTNNSGIDDLQGHNEGQVWLETSDGTEVSTDSYTVDIIDSWTIKISASGLNAGDYTLVVDTLTANSGQTYAGTEVDFTLAA